MADIQSNINVNINTSEALASIRTLQRQISAFYESMARSGAAASAAASNMQNNLINTINQTGKFSASIKTIASTTEAFTTSLEKNKLSMGQYFKFAGGASKTFGKFFKTEMDTIDKVARERVKTLQTQYIKLGRDASGALKSIAIRPLTLDMKDLGTQTAIAAQKQQLMNQLLKQGSTNLLNFGKNTQWAGRQLMVGFTIPLAMVGTAAAKTFMKMEEQAIKFKRVYGDSMTPGAETDAMVKQIRELATEFTKYGVAAEKTMELAATAAAAGKQGLELTAQVREANRLAVLGQVEQQEALSTTISITNAFGIAADQLAKKIDFLNAVENQTVTSIEDLTIAVPKAGPVVKQLGGDVEDLAFFLTAMKEGGINASEGANALKSGLAALINPTGKAADMLASFGINVKGIVEANKGDVKGLVVDFAKALDTLDPLSRARAIEQLFGKFQFSRLSTLFQNVIAEGTQASRVLELTGRSASDLAALSSKELGTVAASSMFKFQKAVEELKMALAPIGEIFLKLITPLLEFGSKVLENFNKLDAGAKNFIVGLIAVVGGLGPVLIMTFGLLANGIANIIKGFMLVRNIFTKSGDSSRYLGDQTEYMTQQQLEAAGVAASLEQVHQRLEQRFTSEAIAVDKLTQALQRANNANLTYMGRNTGTAGAKPKKYAKGVVSVPGPKGAGDIVPAMLSPGEAVIPSKQAAKYAALIQGIVADNLPGYEFSNVDTSDANRPSQARKRKSGGGQSLVIRGGADQAHFDTNENMSMTIREIEAMAESMGRELSSAARTMLQRLADESGQGLDTVIRVWSDKVIMLEGELHKLFTSNAGEDKGPVPVSTVKRVLSEQGKGTYAKTRDTLVSQGVSESDADEQIGLIEQEVSRRLDALGDEAVITSQAFNELVEDVHKAVGEVTRKINEAESDLERAYATMSEIRTFQGKDSKGKPKRQDIFANEPGYQNEKVTAKTRESANKLSDGNILRNRGMKITQDIEDAVGKSEKEILEAWGRIPSRMQDELASIRSNAKGFADRFQEILKTLGISINTSLQTGLSAIPSQAGANVTLGGVGQGLDEAIQRNSPPKEAIKIGRDYGFALNGALRELIPKVRVAGEAFGVAATTGMTTVTPAMRQHLMDSAGRILRPYLDAQTTIIPIAKQKVEILDKEAIASKKAADAGSRYLTTLQQLGGIRVSPRIGPSGSMFDGQTDMRQTEEKVSVPDTVPAESRLSKFNNTVRNSSFVLTSLAAAGTMSGGVIGEMSSKVMQFSGIIFAATTLMDIMTSVQQRQILAQIAHTKAIQAGTIAQGTQMKTGFLAQMGSMLMFSRGKAGGVGFLASLKNAITPLTGAFVAGGKGFKGFINVVKTGALNIGRLVLAAARFIPVIGWIIGGLTLLGFIVKGIVDAKERERLATEGVSDSLISTQKELDATAEALGKEKPKSVMDRIGFGGSAQSAQQQKSTVDELRGNQAFLDQYKADIEAMKTMSQRELQTYQNTLAIQLQATGQYTEDEIQGVIKALQLEANRTDVTLQFKSIDITKPGNFKNNLQKFATNAIDASVSSLNPDQQEESRNIATSGYYQSIISLATAFQNGVIDLKKYNEGVAEVRNSLDSLGESTKKTQVQGIFNMFKENLPETEKEFRGLLDGVSDSNQQLELMTLYTSGAISGLGQLKDVINAFNVVSAGLGPNIDQATLDAANRVLAAVRATADKNNKATDKAFNDVNKNVGGTKSVFQQATESLYDNVKAIKESTKAYSLLSKEGLSASDAFKIAKDPILAAALATTKVGTGKWKELVDRIREFLAITKTSGLSEKISELFGENQRLQNMEKLSRYLQQTGLDAEQVQEVLNDPELADQLLYATGEGKKGFDQIKKTVGFIMKNKEIKISLLPMEEQFKQKMSKVTEAFSAKKNVLDIQFRIDTRASQSIIRQAQADINALNFQADDYEAGLTRLEDGEEAINEKYDNRIEALDKVIAANDRIANQNKEELNIFQMVARGDIAGAAAGIAQLQQQKAKDALEAKKESLQAQRTNELESLTAEVVVNGQKVRMTRNQIEENLKSIKEQIFNIEENTLEPAQRQIEKAQEKLDADTESLRILGLTEDEWFKIEANINESVTSTTAYVKQLQEALDIAKQIPGALAGTSATGGDIVGQKDPVKETDFGKNPKLKTSTKPGSGPGGPGAPVVNATAAREAAASSRASEDSKLLAIANTIPTYGQIFKYQAEIKKKRRGFFESEWERNDNQRNIDNFEKAPPQGYGKTAYTGQPWTDVKGPFDGVTVDGNLVQNVKWSPGGPMLRASGGYISGPGTGTSDSIPALLSNGEYVIRANAVKALGTDTLDKMNYADKNRFADGGSVGRQEAAMAARGGAKSKSNPLADIAKSIFFAPLDMAKEFNNSIGNVLTGKGQGGDFLNVASALPIGKGASLLGKGFGAVKSLIKNRPGSIESMLNRSVIATRMPHDTLLQMLRTGDTKYRTAFETGTGADFIAQTGHLAGKPDPYNKRMRHAMEEYAFAIDYKKNTLEQRPTYGLMATVGPINKALNAISGGKYAKRFNELTNPMNTKLDLYGDISLISNKKVPKRSQFYAGDLRNAYYQNDAHFMYRKTQGINFPPMRGASQAEIAGNPSGFLADKIKPLNIGDSVQFAPYIEAYTRGGFDLSEISKILVSNPNILKTLPQELKKSGLDIPVKLYPGIRSKEILFKTLDFLADIEDKVRGKNTLNLNSQDMPKFADGGLVDRRDAAMAARGRDKLFKKGGAQGFEAGFQGMMSDIGKNDIVKGFGSFLGDKTNVLSGVTRGLLGTLSLPSELMGSVAKSLVTGVGQVSRGDYLGAAGTMLRSATGGNAIDAIFNSYSGLFNPEEQRATMFEQAAEQVIKDKTFGAGTAESNALARIIGGSLNLAGDPLSYLGVGAAAKAVKASASAASAAAKLGQFGSAAKNAGKVAGNLPGVLGLPNLQDVQAIRSVITGASNSELKSLVSSMYKRKNVQIEDDLYPSYTIGENSDNIVFQGKNEELALESVIMEKLLGSKTTVVPTTPQGLLSAALRIDPENINNQTMLGNFKDGNLSDQEYEFLDNINAATSINKKGIRTAEEQTDGFAEILSMLTGNQNAKKLINFKTEQSLKTLSSNKTEKEQQAYQSAQEWMAEYGQDVNLLDPRTVPIIHSTKYPISRDKDGNIILNAHGDFNDDVPRPSLHFAPRATVKDIPLRGYWSPANTKIVTPLSSILNDKTKPYGMISEDIWTMLNPRQSLVLENAAAVRPITNYAEYAKLLVEKGLLQPGKMPPVWAQDIKNKEILYPHKKVYSFVERFQLSQLIGRRVLEGTEASTLDDLSMATAKGIIGTDTKKYTMGEHGLSDQNAQQEIMKLAGTEGITQNLHSETLSGIMENLIAEGSNKDKITGQSYSKLNSDSIELVRMATMQGYFSTFKKDMEAYRKKKRDQREYGVEGATGGLMKNGKFQSPKYFAMGGMVMRSPEAPPMQMAKGGMVAPKYFANGGMVMPKYFAKGGDVVPAMLTPGEFVMTKHAVDNYGVDNLKAINSGAAPGNSVYNGYNINVNVRSNSNPDQIANAVMTQIRQVNAQQVRGSKF
jgi:TP901 family phage tail tape measure protein